MAGLRELPRIDFLAGLPEFSHHSAKVRRDAARAVVQRARMAMRAGGKASGDWVREMQGEFERRERPAVGAAINATGIVLHTGLGRARLAESVVEAVTAVAANHSTLEIDLESGRRGDRQESVRSRLIALTGAEDAMVVNNGASAIFLALSALCQGREVILSRGQMVEIGGSFRMPDIVRQSGCSLVEVGCTNKTRMSDYSGAISVETAAILRCHPSNFRIVGFAEEPRAEEISKLCRERGIALIDDVGSGCLWDFSKWGLPRERTLGEAVRDGANVVTASGDKLLGGPQAGLILGDSASISQIRKHPLARVVRIDKLCLAALEATLRLYDSGPDELPVLKSIARSLADVRRDANKLKRAGGRLAKIEAGVTEVGGGSLPGEGIPTLRVGLSGDPEKLAALFRQQVPPIFGRIERDRFWLDPRTLDRKEVLLVAKAIKDLL